MTTLQDLTDITTTKSTEELTVFLVWGGGKY